MADYGALTAGQRKFVAALLEASSVRAAARAAGVSERSGWRYLADASVRAVLAERSSAMLAQASGAVLSDMGAAREVLRSIMEDQSMPASARVAAARALLDAGLKLFEVVALADRVAALEALAGSVEGGR